MTLAEERELTTSHDPGIPRCSARIPHPLDLVLEVHPALMPCPEYADGYYQGRCPCGHIRDGWLCAAHGAQAGEGGCRACLEHGSGPHDCPLPVARVSAGRAS